MTATLADPDMLAELLERTIIPCRVGRGFLCSVRPEHPAVYGMVLSCDHHHFVCRDAFLQAYRCHLRRWRWLGCSMRTCKGKQAITRTWRLT